MTAARVRKFTFDTEFDDSGAVVRQDDTYKRSWTRAEVEAVRAAAYAEGESSAAAELARATDDAARAIAQVVGALSAEAAGLRRDAAEFGIAAARAAAGVALDRYGPEVIQNLFDEITSLLRDSPAVRVRVADDHVDEVRARLDTAAAQAGFAGSVVVEAAPDSARGDCVIDWRDGAVEASRETIFQRIDEAAARWLATGPHTDDAIEPPAAPDPMETRDE